MSPQASRHLWRRISLFGLLPWLVACGPRQPGEHASEEHEDHDHGNPATAGDVTDQPRFQEGVGLLLPPATQTALGLQTAEVEERPVGGLRWLTAHVFASGPPSRASLTLPSALAAVWEDEGWMIGGARVVGAGAAAQPGERELILELATPQRLGAFVPLPLSRPAGAAVVTVPGSAVLQTTNGPVVYVTNGTAFLRTPVSLGQADALRVEITDGLFAGDVVVLRPVEQLWLAELRFTKGGGHSH